MLYCVKIYCISLLSTVEAVFPNYNSALGALDTPNRDELVEKYFHLGLKAVEILGFLTNIHDFTLCLKAIFHCGHLLKLIKRGQTFSLRNEKLRRN